MDTVIFVGEAVKFAREPEKFEFVTTVADNYHNIRFELIIALCLFFF